ncbi:unnamed protein product [Ostreobium quekettii]|uniref:Haloacid dehalogenase n=1 Tax=Ostreobium quekettii TaxID=121088 RepID=A0A8S1J1J8_9CHLO|nr:unnamed protein product [Ostreobium quekettii]
MKLTDFSALTFDCYGTLIDWETGILQSLRPWADSQSPAPTDGDLLAAFAANESKVQAASPSMPYPQILANAFRGIASDLGIEASDQDADAFGASVGSWPAFPDSPDALAYLKQRYKLVIVSNVDAGSIRSSIAKLGVEFDMVVTAEDAGSYKPAPGHFDAAFKGLGEMGVPRERVLHVAQSLFHDHVPAKALGMTTVFVNRQSGRGGGGATPAPEVPVTPDWEVPTMAAMAELHRQHEAE